MKTRSRQGLRRFQVEVWSYGNYVERIADLKRALAKKPRVLRIEIVGTGEIPADVALRFRSVIDGALAKNANCHQHAFQPARWLGAALAVGRQPDDSGRCATLFSPHQSVRRRRGAGEWSLEK